jgi:hypothetical protein
LDKQQLIHSYSDLTDRVTHNIRLPEEGGKDYDFLHGRHKGYILIFELVQNRADLLLEMAEKDFPKMLDFMDTLIKRLMLPQESVPRSLMPEYYRGLNETLRTGRIVFSMFAKQKLRPEPEKPI